MAVKSGKWGKAIVDGVTLAEFTGWDYSHGYKTEEYVSRSGLGGTKTLSGVESGGGSVEGVLDLADPDTADLPSGKLVDMELYHDDEVAHKGKARLGQRKFSVSMEGGAQTYSVDFTQHGLWEHPGESAPPTTYPAYDPSFDEDT